MEVLGRDAAREGYRVAVDGDGGRIVGLIPERVISRTMRLTGGRGHQTAYDWIARHAPAIEHTLKALAAGRAHEARIAGMVLEEDERHAH